MDISSSDFMKLTINDVSDLLLQDINDTNKTEVGALLYGTDQDGNPYKLSVILGRITDDKQ